MEERKKCRSCGKYLIAFQKNYLHVEEPCAGVLDAIEIEAIIADDFLNKKFKQLYGDPEIDDYDRLKELEDELKKVKGEKDLQETTAKRDYQELQAEKDELINNKILRFLLKLFRRT